MKCNTKHQIYLKYITTDNKNKKQNYLKKI